MFCCRHRFEREFQEPVLKMGWRTAAFSSTGEYVVASTGEKDSHSLYIWSRAFGQLVKVLNETTKAKEMIIDFAYHPTRPIIALCSKSGVLNILNRTMAESHQSIAFAPDF